jgi:hypothetical protein
MTVINYFGNRIKHTNFSTRRVVCHSPPSSYGKFGLLYCLQLKKSTSNQLMTVIKYFSNRTKHTNLSTRRVVCHSPPSSYGKFGLLYCLQLKKSTSNQFNSDVHITIVIVKYPHSPLSGLAC